MNKLFPIVIVFLFLFNTSKAQVNQNGIPFIKNFTLKEYNAGTQNWAIVRDKRGIVYFANKSGILEYDGVEWRLIKTSTDAGAYSLSIDSSDIVYIGSKNEFGCLIPDSIGEMQYKSLSVFLDSEYQGFGNVWGTDNTNDYIFFGTKYHIFRFPVFNQLPKSENINSSIHVIEPIKEYFSSPMVFAFDNTVFIKERKTGLLHLLGDSLQIVDRANFSDGNHISPWTMIPYDANTYLAGTSSKVFLIDRSKINDTIYAFTTEADDYFSANKIYHGSLLQGNRFVFGTRQKGAAIIGEKGQLLEFINKKTGLYDEAVKYVFCNVTPTYSEPLWLALNNGISRVETNSPFRYWNETNGLRGTVYDVLPVNQSLYVATNFGVFYLQNDEFEIPYFEHIAGISKEAWSLAVIREPENTEDNIIVASTEGVFRIRGNNAIQIRDDKALKLYNSKTSDNELFIGLDKGIALMTLKNGVLSYKKSDEIKERIRYMAQEKEGDLWLGSEIGEAIKVTKDEKAQINISRYDSLKGLPGNTRIQVFHYNNALVFTGNNKFYSYNKTNDKFTEEQVLSSYFNENVQDIFRFVQDKEGNCWFRITGTGSDFTEGLIKQEDVDYKRFSAPFKRLPEMSVQVIYPDTNGILWIGGSEGLFSYNLETKKNFEAPFQALIRRVLTSDDSVLFKGTYFQSGDPGRLQISVLQPESLKPVLEYQFNKLNFHFAAPFFEEENMTEYSYKLDEFDKKWSKWTKETNAVYTNLNEGKYIFRVKARNIYGTESTEAHYEFTVLPPWYRTILAYIVYFILISLFIYFLIKLNTRRLIREKERLERIVQERTYEIREKNKILGKQKDEIEAQAQQLELQNKELEKLSIVASETDNAIMIMNEIGNFEWVNDSFIRLFGYKIEELKANSTDSLSKFYSGRFVEELIYDCIENKRTVEYESLIISKTNEKIWVQATITPILKSSGEINKIIAINSNINRLKEAEAEILQQKEEIEAQRDELEIQRDLAQRQRDQIAEHQKAIMDSIYYARRIQTAVLPPKHFVNKILPEHFILYKPRDVVSGDFYWMTKRETKLIFAAADCTGHGVPGAFMSMLGIAFLNEIVNKAEAEMGITLYANEILNELRSHVIKSLRQTGKEGEAKDGMDIALCIVDLETKQLQFAGAYNPLYIVRDNGDEQEIVQVKADKMPIGIYYRGEKPFKNNEVQLHDSDTIYIFSDGYCDQFGGDDGRKFMSKKFKRMLLEIHDKEMEEQKEILDETIVAWMGEKYEQLDDILVLGIRI